MADVSQNSQSQSNNVNTTESKATSATSPVAYVAHYEPEKPPRYFLTPSKRIFDRMCTPKRLLVFFILGVGVLILSYILYLSGLPGSSLKNKVYVYRMKISEDIYGPQQRFESEQNNPQFGYFSIYPTNYCVQEFGKDAEINYQPFKCYGMSSHYVFDVYKEFTTKTCSSISFKGYRSASKKLANMFLGAVVVNSLWLIVFVAMIVTRKMYVFFLVLLMSFVSLIFSLMMAIIHKKPGNELSKLACFNSTATIWGASSAFKGMSWTAFVLSLLQVLFACYFIMKPPTSQRKRAKCVSDNGVSSVNLGNNYYTVTSEYTSSNVASGTYTSNGAGNNAIIPLSGNAGPVDNGGTDCDKPDNSNCGNDSGGNNSNSHNSGGHNGGHSGGNDNGGNNSGVSNSGGHSGGYSGGYSGGHSGGHSGGYSGGYDSGGGGGYSGGGDSGGGGGGGDGGGGGGGGD